MPRSRSLIRAFALVAVLTLGVPGFASAAKVIIETNDDTFEEIRGRGTHAQNWVPVLDGSVFVDPEHGTILVRTHVRPGGEDFNGPVLVTAGVGARCVETGNPPHAKVYLFDCLEHVPHSPPRGSPDA